MRKIMNLISSFLGFPQGGFDRGGYVGTSPRDQGHLVGQIMPGQQWVKVNGEWIELRDDETINPWPKT